MQNPWKVWIGQLKFCKSTKNSEDYDKNSKLNIERMIFRKYRKANIVIF